MTTIENTYKLEICTDCYMYAHGVLEESEHCNADKISGINQAFEQFGQYLVETHHDIGICSDDDQCNCAEASFSRYACHTCNDSLGGDRYDVLILTLAS